MRSAVFLPTPGMRGQPRDVLAAHRADQLRRLDARQHRERQLRSDAADRDQPLEQILLERRREPVERDARPRARACACAARPPRRLAEPVERRQRHLHVVADAADVDDDAARTSSRASVPRETRDHGAVRRASCGGHGRSARQLRRRRGRSGVPAAARAPRSRRSRCARGRSRRRARRRRRAATAPRRGRAAA